MKKGPMHLVPTFLFIFFLLFYCDSSYAEDVVKIQLYPDTGLKVNPVSLLYSGKVYAKSWWFDEISSGVYTAAEDESFIMRVVEVNRNGSREDLLKLWSPDERAGINTDISDPDIFKANQDFYKKRMSSAFIAKILYGSYTIFFIQHTGTQVVNQINEYPIIKIDNQYYLTNKLSSDSLFSYIALRYEKTFTFKQRD